ncbi:hypothetical protein [Paenibacillus sp. URB8-2]|uniref:hypothetical protein n=1 Tax=Paenibacillus sp. URB8-2 TaxID=2741301 RepID=UPI0015B96FEE|nr:hypothetical protein [Paenibacillus sp. URB8-2]BCG57465.1 hypothetical protein PUR_08900 [Paenibacillus sp. URB8-2]
MDHKKVLKQTLYNFVEKKVKFQKEEARKEIEALISATINPILNEWIQVKQIETDASNLADRLTELSELYPCAISWDVKNVIRSLNRTIFPLGTDMRNRILDDICDYVHHPTRSEVNLNNEALENATRQLQKDVQPLSKKLADLSTLENELNRVIGAEANGARAYKALVALGVDLSEVEDVSPNLPAIVKLSVDPAMLAQA